MVILSLKVVLRAGLEPTTLCLEGRCSIQLSYRSTQVFSVCRPSLYSKSARTARSEPRADSTTKKKRQTIL